MKTLTAPLPVKRSTSTSETTAPQMMYPSSLSLTACPLWKIYIVNPRLEVDLYYKSILLEVGLYSHVVPLRIIKTLLLGRF